ncbi:MAG TPA: condensation domain-containing protein, partial [Longimicrobiaceae bacterium]|nr:condensation domain-containing protein [Longimicrobiaceae bacterium]
MGLTPEQLARLSPERRFLLQRMLLQRAGAERSPQEIRRRPAPGPAPLSFAQQRLWLIDRIEPGSPAYNIPYALRLRGRLDPGALRRALDEVARRQESLRTVFRETDGEAVQVVLPAAPVPLPTVDLRALPPGAREEELRRRVEAESLRPFDLAQGPLFRVLLLRLDAGEWGLLLTLHHIVSDGWSTGVLIREVSAAYEAVTSGRAPELPELPVQYADYAVWQRGYLEGERLEGQLAWWRERLAGAPPVLEIPTDRPRPPVVGARGDVHLFTVPAGTAAALREWARAEGATLFMVLMAGWQLLLARWSGEEDVCVGTAVAGRTRREIEGVVGFFINTLVLRGDLSGNPAAREWLGRVREGTLDAFAHGEVPFEKLVEELRPERSLQHTPFFQSMLVLQNTEQGELRLGPLEVSPLEGATGPAKFDLSLTVYEAGGELRGALAYRTELFDPETTERMAGQLVRLLAGMAADPGRRVGEVELLAPEEREALLAAGRGADGEPGARPLPEQFTAQAARTPDAVALISDREQLTYAQLERRANRLAHHLRALGTGPEIPVGVLLPWTPELPTALLAVLKAGGVYTPLDPSHPPERLAHIARDAGVRVLVTTADLAPTAPAEVHTVRLDTDAERIAARPSTPPQSGIAPESLAYVIYTSGSTGRPKGVAVEHRAAAAHFPAMARALGVGPQDRLLQLASAGFDVSLEQVLVPLLAGASLVLRGPEPWSAAEFPARAGALGITVANLAPAYAQEVVESGGVEALRGLRLLLIGADVLPVALVRR